MVVTSAPCRGDESGQALSLFCRGVTRLAGTAVGREAMEAPGRVRRGQFMALGPHWRVGFADLDSDVTLQPTPGCRHALCVHALRERLHDFGSFQYTRN